MSTEPPAGTYLARSLEPHEREQIEGLRRQLIQQLRLGAVVFLTGTLAAVLFVGRREHLPLEARIAISVIVVVLAASVWIGRRVIGRLTRDLEQGAVYCLEGILENMRLARETTRFWRGYEFVVSGERFDVSKSQFDAGVAKGAPCTVEFLPASRLALTVNSIKRWP